MKKKRALRHCGGVTGKRLRSEVANETSPPTKVKSKPKSPFSKLGDHQNPLADVSANRFIKATRVDVQGGTAPDGMPWVNMSAADGNANVWVPLDELLDDAAPAKRRMRAARLFLFKDNLTNALDLARNVNAFPPLPLIDAPGWSGPHFALRSGEVFSPDDHTDTIVLFEPDPVTCAARGGKAWSKGAKRLGKGQPIVTFALMIPFAGPLLQLSRVRENIGFELSGPKGVGKSSLQHLSTSTIGPALEPAGKNYWITANTTMNALEAEMPRHTDTIMVIEELSVMHAGDSEKIRANHMREFVFRMAQGTAKSRYQEEKKTPVRFVWLTSTNDPLATLLGKYGGDAGEAAGDRLLALPIGPNRKHGIFKAPLPKGCATGEDAARAIADLVAGNYGRPMRRFLRRLVKGRAKDEAGLRAVIEAFILEFRDAVGVDGNTGSEARVADAFGLVYAAGRLAQRYGALPKKLDCLAAACKCYRINRKSMDAEVSNVERLQRLARHKGVVCIDLEDHSKAYLKRLAAAPALIRIGKGGKRELLLSKEQFERAFPMSNGLLADTAVKKLMRHDKGRNTIKIQVSHSEEPKRYRCFSLTATKA